MPARNKKVEIGFMVTYLLYRSIIQSELGEARGVGAGWIYYAHYYSLLRNVFERRTRLFYPVVKYNSKRFLEVVLRGALFR